MKILKKSTAVFLIVLTLFTMVPLNGYAKDYIAETEENIRYKATNALGKLLSDGMNEENEEKGHLGYYVDDITVEDNVATVYFCAPDDATLILAVYDDSGKELITLSQVSVDKETDVIEIGIDVDLPEYFLMKSFIVDSENKPVCKEFECVKYTEAFEVFYEKTVDDFEEEKVIQLDESEEKNFAVVSDEAQVVEETPGENVLTVENYEEGIYVFENANEEISSLQKGEVLHYRYGDGPEDYVLAKIGSIKNDDGTVTITASDDYEISDFFSYIKIDTEEVEENAEEEIDPVNGRLKKSDNEEDQTGEANGSTKKFEQQIEIGTDSDNDNDDDDSGASEDGDIEGEAKAGFKVSFIGTLTILMNVRVYYDVRWLKGDIYYDVSTRTTTTLSGDLGITFYAEAGITQKVKEKEFKPVKDVNVPIVAGVEAVIGFSVRFKVSGELRVSGGLEIVMVDGVRRTSGGVEESLSQEPIIKFYAKSEVKIQFDIIPTLSVGVEVLQFVQIELQIGVGINIVAKMTLFEVSSKEEEYPDVKHPCTMCVDGEINFIFDGHVECTYGFNKNKRKRFFYFKLWELTLPFGNFFCSFGRKSEDAETVEPEESEKEDTGNGESGEDTEEVGPDGYPNVVFSIGKCFFKEYRTTIRVLDAAGNRIPGAEIMGDDGIIRTDENGEAIVYYPEGTHHEEATWETEGETFKEYFIFKIEDQPRVVEIRLTEYETDEAPETKEEIEAVTCNLYGTITDDQTYEPIVGAKLRFVNKETGATTYATTNGKGKYSINLLNGTYDVLITCKDYVDVGFDLLLEGKSCRNDEEMGLVDRRIAWGFCGVKAEWTLYESGKLVIEGSENMHDYIELVEAPWHEYRAYVKHVIVENGITYIGVSNFYDMTNLADVTLPETVQTIAKDAFNSCVSLVNVNLGGTKTIGNAAFANCTALVNIDLGVTETIENSAFSGCNALESIIIPDSTTTIGKSAFWDCYSMKEAVIGNGVTTIGMSAFGQCSDLETVCIGSSVTNIDLMAFVNAKKIQTVYYNGTQEQWNNISIGAAGNDTLTSANIICTDTYSLKKIIKMVMPYLKQSSVENVTRKTVTDTVYGYAYLIVVVKDPESDFLLDPSNVLYIDQKEAEGDTVTFEFILEEGIEYTILIFDSDCTHNHDYAEVDSLSASCTEDGYTSYICTTCKVEYTEVIAATGHSDENEDDVCDVCGYSDEETTTEPTTTVPVTTEPTTTEPSTTVPTTTKPITTDPTATVPTTTDPTTTEKVETTEAPQTEPVVTAEPTTELTTEPATQPATTKPTTTEKVETTEAPQTEPVATTEPATIEPSTTEKVETTETTETEPVITVAPTTQPTTEPTTEEPCTTEAEESTETTAAPGTETVTKPTASDDVASQTNHTATKPTSSDKEEVIISIPADIKAKAVMANAVTLTWGAVNNADKYVVYYSADGKVWEKKDAFVNKLKVSKLKSGTKYMFKVSAVVDGKEGQASEILTLATKPSKVSVTSVKSVAPDKAVVTWKKVAGANGYEVLCSTSKKFKKKTTKTVTVKKAKKTKITIKKLKSGKKYFVKVRAYKKVDGKKIYGAYSKVKYGKIK